MQKIAVSIAEAVQITGISRSYLYRHLNEGTLVAHKNGKRTLIFMTDLRKFLKSLQPTAVKAQGARQVGELLKQLAPRPWAVDIDEDDKTVTIVDADGFEVCQFWYNNGDGPTPNRASSPYDAVVVVEAVNAFGG